MPLLSPDPMGTIAKNRRARVMGYVKRIGSKCSHPWTSKRLFASQSSVDELTYKTLYRGSGGGKPRGRDPMLSESGGSVFSRWNVGWGMVPHTAPPPARGWSWSVAIYSGAAKKRRPNYER